MINRSRQEQIRTFNAENQEAPILTSLLQQLNYSIDQYSHELENLQIVSKLPKLKQSNSKRSASSDNTCYNPQWLIDKDKKRIIERHNKEFHTFLPSFIWEKETLEQPRNLRKQTKPILGTINKPRILLPKEFRKNPLNQRKRIYESLIYKEGLCNLINKGMIDKHIDVSPAFEQTLVVLFVLVTLSHGISSKLSHAKKLEELRSTKFGKTILNLIHLHSQVQGPIEELLDAVEELVADINTNIDEVEFKFQQRTNEHNSYVATIDQQLQDADQDIARMIDVIDNLLVPRRDQIHNKVTSLIQYDEFNRRNVEEVQVVRETEHEQFLQQIAEDNDALDAVDDAVQLVSSLTNPSLLQIKNIKFTLKRLSTKQWNRVHQGPMVQALLQIALNQNFSDQGVLKQIVDALNEFRNQVVDAMNDLTKQEQINQEEYEERLDQLEVEHREFQKQITQAQLDLDATNQKINDCSQFLVQRQADRMQYQSQLNLENETYAVDSEIYNQTIGELQRELPIAEQGLQLIKSADFSDINIQNL